MIFFKEEGKRTTNKQLKKVLYVSRIVKGSIVLFMFTVKERKRK